MPPLLEALVLGETFTLAQLAGLALALAAIVASQLTPPRNRYPTARAASAPRA